MEENILSRISTKRGNIKKNEKNQKGRSVITTWLIEMVQQ